MLTQPNHIGPQHDRQIDRRSFMPLLGAGAAFAMLAGKAQAQQVPIPTTARGSRPGPPTGTAMTKAYVQSVGRWAYLWGWPLVNNAARHAGILQSARTGPARRGPADRSQRARDVDQLRQPGTALRYAARTRMLCTGSAFLTTWIKSQSSSRYRISATAFGSMRFMTRVPMNSPRSASNTAPSPASTWWSARTGKERRHRELRQCCDLPLRWSPQRRAFSWTTRRRITPPSSRFSARLTDLDRMGEISRGLIIECSIKDDSHRELELAIFAVWQMAKMVREFKKRNYKRNHGEPVEASSSAGADPTEDATGSGWPLMPGGLGGSHMLTL